MNSMTDKVTPKSKKPSTRLGLKVDGFLLSEADAFMG
jgi:hypothetical protein